MSFDYSARDYSTIKSALLSRASRVMPEWTDRDPSDFGMLMVDLWSYMGDVLHYYVDRAATESYLPTATQRESVLALASMLDYRPRSRRAASGTVTLSNSSSSPVLIPSNTSFTAIYDSKSYQLYTPNGGTVPAGGSVSLEVYEGSYVDEEPLSVSSGNAGQRFTLRNDGVDTSTITVNVYEDGVTARPYRRVDRLKSVSSQTRAFEPRISADGDVDILFGNGVFGVVPPNGSSITASYLYCSGFSGNLPAGSVVGFTETTPSNITITASSALTGGADDESIDSLKNTVPSVVSAQDRAITESDYNNLTLQVSTVAKSANSYNSGTGVITIYPHPDVGSLFTTSTDTSYAVPAALQAEVEEYLQSRSVLGVTVDCATSITWTHIYLELTLHLNPTAVAPWVQDDVEAAIINLFSFNNVGFGYTATLGSVYRAVLSVPGVDYAVVTKFNTDDSSTVESSISIAANALPKVVMGSASDTVVISIDPTDSGVSP